MNSEWQQKLNVIHFDLNFQCIVKKNTRKHSSRIRTAPCCGSGGAVRYTLFPRIPYPLPSRKGHKTRDTLPPPLKDMGPETKKGPGTRDTLPQPPNPPLLPRPVERQTPVRTLPSLNFVGGR